MNEASRRFVRHSRAAVLAALADTRVVLLTGARQVGKSTLATDLLGDDFPATVANLDDRLPRERALDDPEGFLHGLGSPALIDEVQRGGPELLLAIKASVDRDQRPGRFLLTGSANLLASRKTPDTLAGRVERITLWPLSQCEIEGTKANLVDALFAAEPPMIAKAMVGRDAFVDRVLVGGFPAVQGRSEGSRQRWFRAYVEGIVDRDLSDLADAQRLAEIPRLLRMLAARSASPLVYQELSRKLSMDAKTAKSYVRLLELAYAVKVLPGWRPSLASREAATPKVYIVDSGMLTALLNADRHRLSEDDQVTGRALESFVAMELIRHIEWAEQPVNAYHYRVGDREIDLILETWSGEVVGVEIKSTVSLSRRDWRTLANVRDRLGDRFRAGVIIHPGHETQPLGDRLWALPISGLWEQGPRATLP